MHSHKSVASLPLQRCCGIALNVWQSCCGWAQVDEEAQEGKDECGAAFCARRPLKCVELCGVRRERPPLFRGQAQREDQ